MYYSARPKSISLLLCFALLLGAWLSAAVPAAADEGVPVPSPSAPQNLRIAEGTLTHNSVGLEWDFVGTDLDPQNPNDIDIWDADTDAYITWGNLWTRAIGGLEPETAYRVYITWYERPATRLHRSNVLEFTTTADTDEYQQAPLAPPLNLKVSAVNDNSISFQWTGSPGADGYDFYVNGGWKGGVWDGSNTYTYSLTEEEAVAGAVHTFAVGAQRTVGGVLEASANSNAVALTWGELAAPRDAQVITANRTTATLGWAPVPGATVYDIYRDGELLGSSAESRYIADGLQEGQTYIYTVVARNDSWQSPPGDSVAAVPGANYTNVTYYTSWSVFERDFHPEDVDVTQVTHINYAFADLCWQKVGTRPAPCENENLPLQDRYVHDGEIIIGDADVDPGNLAAFAEIKESNPHLKMMISVGGWSWSKNFSNMAADEVTRRAFADSAVKFLRAYGLDGLDIDWEYPVEGGETHNTHRPEDKQNFTLLMKTLRDALDAAGSEDGQYYLLTIASGQGDNFVVNADLANAAGYLDFINIMTYDYSGSWEMLAHHNSPLYYDGHHPRDTASRNNARGGAVGHLNGGVPNYKLVLGLPFYGKGWTGCEAPGEYAACTGIPAGTWESGIFDYTDLEANFVGQAGYTRYWNDAAKVAYLYNADTGTFITYNDRTAMTYSASLVKTLDLAGVMSWEISGDRNRTLTTQLARDLPTGGAANPQALHAPAEPTAASVGQTSITLQWEAVEGASGYEIFVNDAYAGATETTGHILGSLTAATEYAIRIFAIAKEGDEVAEVSPASGALRVATPGWPTSSGGSAPQQPAKAPNELDAAVTKNGGTWSVSIAKDAAVKNIRNSDYRSFTVTVSDEAAAVEVLLPQEVAEALGGKGPDAELSIVWGGIVYVIPAGALPADADLRISIAPPNADIANAIAGLAEESGLAPAIDSLDFRIERLASGDDFEEITDFGGHTFKRVYTLNAEALDIARSTGVVYLPETNEFRPVATTFAVNEDGTVTAELRRQGNSIYTIVESPFRYTDAIPDWALDAAERATARLIVSGETDTVFGAGETLTRAEFISIVARGLGILPDYSVHPFRDVASDSAYAGDIAAAKRLGLVRGKTADTFDPDGFITRQEMAAILADAWKHAGKPAAADTAALARFGDSAAIAAYAQASVALMAEQGIMRGVSSDRISPLSNVTKAQAVVAVVRLLDALEQ